MPCHHQNSTRRKLTTISGFALKPLCPRRFPNYRADHVKRRPMTNPAVWLTDDQFLRNENGVETDIWHRSLRPRILLQHHRGRITRSYLAFWTQPHPCHRAVVGKVGTYAGYAAPMHSSGTRSGQGPTIAHPVELRLVGSGLDTPANWVAAWQP